jgi:hypothetical protein
MLAAIIEQDIKMSIKQTILTYLKNILTTILLIVLSQTTFGTTWGAAYPYIQQIEGQNVVVKAIPYDPFSGSPMIGLTEVYLNNKLLYSIDKYYREKIFTSEDGEYLVVVHTSNSEGMLSYSSFGMEHIKFNQKAIEVFKNGQPFKTFTVKDVVDTTKFLNNERFLNWIYYVDLEAFQMAKFGCESCKEVYGRRVLRTIDTSEIDIDDWEKCRRECDSAGSKNTAVRISQNAIYVQGNSLFVLTSQHTVVKLNFAEMTIQQVGFDKEVPNIKIFNPPTLKRKYKKLKYPEKFLLPELYNGKTIDQALAELLNKRVSIGHGDSAAIRIYFHTLLINKEGKCEQVYVSPSIRDDLKKDFMYFENDEKLKEIIEEWIKLQTFKTATIPKEFFKYNFEDFVYLK